MAHTLEKELIKVCEQIVDSNCFEIYELSKNIDINSLKDKNKIDLHEMFFNPISSEIHNRLNFIRDIMSEEYSGNFEYQYTSALGNMVYIKITDDILNAFVLIW